MHKHLLGTEGALVTRDVNVSEKNCLIDIIAIKSFYSVKTLEKKFNFCCIIMACKSIIL